MKGEPTAFVFFTTELGYEDEVVREIRKYNGVREAHALYGKYDGIAVVDIEGFDKIKDLITNRIRKTDHLASTITYLVIEED